jgi:hypothetical protein
LTYDRLMMGHALHRRETRTGIAAIVVGICIAGATIAAQQATKPNKGTVIRGCLTGWKLTHIDPDDATLTIPDVLQVRSLRVIRDQVKALNGHQVEVIGSLEGIPGQQRGVLVAGSDSAKLYVGGGDKNLGEDFGVQRSESPTIYVRTIKDIDAACAAARSPQQ